MKVIFLIDHMSGFGGAQRVIANLANAVSIEGNAVCIMLTGNTTKSVYDLNENIKIMCFQKQNEISVSTRKKIRRMRNAIKMYSPEVVISFLTMVNVMTIMATLGLKIPVIISERNDPDKCSRKEKILSNLFYRFSRCIVVQTEDIKGKITKFYKGKICVIENPIVQHTVNKTDYTATNKIIAIGRLNRQKNYTFMLNAFSVFVKNHRNCILDIYGTGEEEKRLKQLASDLKIEQNVLFKGNVNGILQFERDYDFFIMTSDFEGMPNALAEAMSVGLPCISIDCDGGGAAALIDTEQNGILVKKGDYESFVTQMNRLYADTLLREAIGESAKSIRGKLSKDNVVNKWNQTIREVICK